VRLEGRREGFVLPVRIDRKREEPSGGKQPSRVPSNEGTMATRGWEREDQSARDSLDQATLVVSVDDEDGSRSIAFVGDEMRTEARSSRSGLPPTGPRLHGRISWTLLTNPPTCARPSCQWASSDAQTGLL